MRIAGQNVYVGMLSIMIIGTFLSQEEFFVLSIAYYLILLIKRKLKIKVPSIPGIKLYLFFILYGSIVGFLMYDTRNVVRDLYYFLPTLLWIFIGSCICLPNHEKKLFKTLFLYGAFISIKAVMLFIISFSTDFNSIRSVFGLNVYDVGIILPVTVVQIFLHDQIYISKKTDRFILFLMLLQIVLSLGRIAILQPMLMLAVLMVMESRRKTDKKILIRITKLLVITVVVLSIAFYVMPDNIKNPLFQKVLNSLIEVDASREFNSVGDAMGNWRAYEIQSAQKQWKTEWPLAQIFGEGIGKGVEIQYIPYNWGSIVGGNEIPLLHNGFYTMLIKGGLLGIAALIWIFVGNVIKGFKLSKSELLNEYANILIAVSVAGIANTYVVCGPIQQGTFLVWAVLLGGIKQSVKEKDCYDVTLNI